MPENPNPHHGRAVLLALRLIALISEAANEAEPLPSSVLHQQIFCEGDQDRPKGKTIH
jgi:hypothetical protein